MSSVKFLPPPFLPYVLSYFSTSLVPFPPPHFLPFFLIFLPTSFFCSLWLLHFLYCSTSHLLLSFPTSYYISLFHFLPPPLIHTHHPSLSLLPSVPPLFLSSSLFCLPCYFSASTLSLKWKVYLLHSFPTFSFSSLPPFTVFTPLLFLIFLPYFPFLLPSLFFF